MLYITSTSTIDVRVKYILHTSLSVKIKLSLIEVKYNNSFAVSTGDYFSFSPFSACHHFFFFCIYI